MGRRNPMHSMHGRGVTQKEDKWFSKAIRQRDRNTCRSCQQSFNEGIGLECAHLHGRRHKSVRFDPMNAVALCKKCHHYFTGEPLEWASWCQEELGANHMLELGRRKNAICKLPESARQAISDHYRTEYNRMVKTGTHDLQPWQNDYLCLTA